MGLFLFFFVAFGGSLLYLGIRGRRVGAEPVCSKCGFDLSGLVEPTTRKPVPSTSAPARACPECGLRLQPADNVCIGRLHRRRWAIVLGSMFLILGFGTTYVASLPAVANFKWINHKPERWLLRDAVAAYKNEVNNPPVLGYFSWRAYHDANLPELLRRAEKGTLSDKTLLSAAQSGIQFIQDWYPVQQFSPPRASADNQDASWPDLVIVAAERRLLSKQERVDFCTSTLRLALRTPDRIVQGDPLPIEFLYSAWIPSQNVLDSKYLHESWPTGWSPGVVDFVLQSAEVDGQPIHLIQFEPDGTTQRRYSPRELITVPARVPVDEHPRADFAPGRHTLRVVMHANLPNHPMVTSTTFGFLSLDDLGFPTDGWTIALEKTFEVVESGPTRTTTPLVGSLGLVAVLERWEDSSTLTLEIAAPYTDTPRPAWLSSDAVFAARLDLKLDDQVTPLGPWVNPFVPAHSQDILLTPGQLTAIASDPDRASVIVTVDPELAKLITAPGPLIICDPIEVPIITREEWDKMRQQRSSPTP